MNKLLGLCLLLTACAHGGSTSSGTSPATSAPQRGATVVKGSRATMRQDLGASIAAWTPVRGPSNAVLTLVEYADFQCPFCSRVHATIETLRNKYPDKLRVAFRHLPLPFHPQAKPAAEAAMAALAQGKFWEMHDHLFALAGQVSDEAINAAAKQSGLDMPAFEKALSAHTYAKAVEDDAQHADEMGVHGTPTFFLNGVKISGAQPLEVFESAIADELKVVATLTAAGTTPEHLYDVRLATVTKEQHDDAPSKPSKPDVVGPQRALLAKWTPVRGPKAAKITIVEYSDFQCPFCARANTTLKALREEFGAELRIAYRHNPLPFHPNARMFAEMSFAAQDQGKFWEMNDYLFEHQADGSGDDFAVTAAKAIQLDVARFNKSMGAHAHAADIDADIAEAKKLGANGTPTFFINGSKVIGAQPIESFRDTIKAEQKKAQALLDKGVALKDLYDKTMAAIPAP